jgi:hypothetical protein
MTAIAPERAVAIGSAAEQFFITARDPAKVEHLTAHISLN